MSRLSEFLRRHIHADEAYTEYISIKHVQPQDVFIVGFPKSGNTWLQLLVSAMRFEIQPQTAPDTLVQELVPDVHFKRHYKRFLHSMAFKTHDLPRREYRRVVNIVRDGRDALCSYKHFNDTLGNHHSLDDMIDQGAGLFPCRWHEHVAAWEQNPFNAERIVVRYEDLKRECETQLKRVADFLAIDVTQERLADLAERTRVANMQLRETTLGWSHPAWPKDRKFVRKGVSGTFRAELSPSQIARFENQAAEMLMRMGYALELARCA